MRHDLHGGLSCGEDGVGEVAGMRDVVHAEVEPEYTGKIENWR